MYEEKLNWDEYVASKRGYSPKAARDKANSPWEDPLDPKTWKANDVQYGGNHYKQFQGHEPWDVITAWKLGYLDGTAVKYIARWKHKGGKEDIRKAIHFLQKLLEVEDGRTS